MSGSSSLFVCLSLNLHTHHFYTNECFLIGARTTSGTHREHPKKRPWIMVRKRMLVVKLKLISWKKPVWSVYDHKLISLKIQFIKKLGSYSNENFIITLYSFNYPLVSWKFMKIRSKLINMHSSKHHIRIIPILCQFVTLFHEYSLKLEAYWSKYTSTNATCLCLFKPNLT